ncbi:MAG: hypothetical protein BGO98_00335 [Myxococcales bacterium 68-20]|nr:MAG: hypothetical protein BGO98_00335 [Myxococcales bacterium 68-20]
MKMTRSLLPRLLAGSFAFGVLLTATDVSADVQACLAASEQGQHARAAGKLREAREHFVVCGGAGCPALVRQDCAQWNSELAQALPTVVFGARDEQGRDLFDVLVSMDGETIVKKLDGKAVTVDPGKHTFRFEAEGFPVVSETVLIKEGERARVVDVMFEREGDAETEVAPAGRKKGHTPYPWIVVGIGAVGVAAGAVLIATAPARPANCDASTEMCSRVPGQSEAAFRKNQEDAGSADSQPLLGYIVAGSGLALVAGGLLWHFLEPTGSKRPSTALRVMPWTTGRSSGVTLGARF